MRWIAAAILLGAALWSLTAWSVAQREPRSFADIPPPGREQELQEDIQAGSKWVAELWDYGPDAEDKEPGFRIGSREKPELSGIWMRVVQDGRIVYFRTQRFSQVHLREWPPDVRRSPDSQ